MGIQVVLSDLEESTSQGPQRLQMLQNEQFCVKQHIWAAGFSLCKT